MNLREELLLEMKSNLPVRLTSNGKMDGTGVVPAQDPRIPKLVFLERRANLLTVLRHVIKQKVLPHS